MKRIMLFLYYLVLMMSSSLLSQHAVSDEFIERNTDNRQLDAGIHWISFPRIKADSLNDGLWLRGNSIDESVTLRRQLSQFETIFKSVHVDSQDVVDYADWSGVVWNNGTVAIRSCLGYKIELENTVEMSLAGPKLPDTTKVPIKHTCSGVSRFWLGFWKEGKHYNFHDFVTEIEDYCIAIKHQDWFIYRTGSVGNYVWEGEKNAFISYGDMIELVYDKSFTFAGWGKAVENQNKEISSYQSQYFSFEEQVDYLPVIVKLPDFDDVKEVGIYIGDDCKGFGRVNNNIAYIRAYMLEEQNHNNKAISFAVKYKGTDEIQVYKSYRFLSTVYGYIPVKINLMNPEVYYILAIESQIDSQGD